jgi:hypothetical protein
MYWKPSKSWADPEYLMRFNRGSWEQILDEAPAEAATVERAAG